MCDLSTCYFILGTDGKDMETKSDQEKFLWSNAMIDDMIDIICSDEILEKKLIFSNQKFAANANIFEKIADLTNQRAANNDRKYTMSFSQARNKFIKFVSECKSISLTKRSASGIARYQGLKGLRKMVGDAVSFSCR